MTEHTPTVTQAAGRSGSGGRDGEADVVVVGAGPSGSATAYYLAQAGLDVLLLEKSRFPREKVCGDGLTPRGVKALVAMGISVSEQDGWVRNKGLRVIGAGQAPGAGLARAVQLPGVRPGPAPDRSGPDAGPAGPSSRGQAERGSHRDRPRPRRPHRPDHRSDGPPGWRGREERTYAGRVIVAADGNSSRLSVAMGLRKRDDRPLGVAVRTYYRSPRHEDDYLESWLDLWDGDRLLPGYGWIFGMGDGTSNVGLGLLNTSTAFGHTDYHAMLRKWLKGMPAEWGFTEANRTQPIRGAALPMGFNRTPHYFNGLLLVGDAGGMVNPFNGEGIAYAMESGEILARTIAQALARARRAETERVLAGYPQALTDAYGGYYALAAFREGDRQAGLMRFATNTACRDPPLMRFVIKLLPT